MKRFILWGLFFIFWSTAGKAQPAQNLTQAIRYIKLAGTLRAVDKSDESINLLKRALPATQKSSFYWEAVTNESMGLSYSDLRDTTAALPYLERARTQYLKLKYVASAWGVNEIIRNLSNKNLYAGIQIGTSGVKLVILKTRYETDFYEKDIQSTVEIASPAATFFADASGTYKAEQNALKVCLDSIRRYHIPSERVFIVLSNEVRDELARHPQARQSLYRQLTQVLPGGKLTIDTTLTARREAELFTIGAIPRNVWPTTSALHIGLHNTSGGYFEQTTPMAPKTFRGITVPVGINSLVEQVDNKRSLNLDAFKREAQRQVKAIAEASLARQINATNRGLQQRRTVGIGGDVVWALITCLHPEKAGVTAVVITPDDLERFRQLALNDYKELTRPNLSGISNPSVREQAERDLRSVQNQFTEKQLVAGALWLEAIQKAYASPAHPKRFVFVRNADLGWVTGKFLETINYEYESTIAQGALYTR